MRQIINVAVFLLVSFFLFSCTATTQGVKKTEQNSPKTQDEFWLNPQNSDNTYYYGVGSGETQDRAKVVALKNISADILVKISSDTTIQKTISNDSYSRNVQENIKTSVEKIDFTNAQIIKQARHQGLLYVLVRVSKQELLNNHLKDLQSLKKQLTALNDLSQKNGQVYYFLNQKTSDLIIQNAKNKLVIANAIDKNAKTKDLETFFNSQSQLIQQKIVNLRFFVDSKDAYAQVLKNHLLRLGVKSVDRFFGKANDVIIKLRVNATPKELKSLDPRFKNAHFAKVEITISTKDNTLKTVAQNTINLTNVSKKSYEDAKNNTSKFDAYIKKNSIQTTLIK